MYEPLATDMREEALEGITKTDQLMERALEIEKVRFTWIHAVR